MKTRSFVLAAAGLLPAIVAAIVVFSVVLDTFAAIFVIFAGWELGAVGLVAYLVTALALFLGLVAASSVEHRWSFPWISLMAALLGVSACAWYTTAAWDLGLRYQGHFSVYAAMWLNALTVAGLALLLARNARRQEHRTRVLFHWALVVWLSAWAFPYFGEMP